MPAGNSTYPKVAVQWLNQALCFYQSFCLVDSEVLRNRHLRVAANRCRAYKNKQMNKKLTVLLLLVISIQSTFANDLDNGIIELGKIYRDFVFRNNPTDLTLKQIDEINSPELLTTKDFVKECITLNNSL